MLNRLTGVLSILRRFCLIFGVACAIAGTLPTSAEEPVKPAKVSTISTQELSDFESQPASVQRLITRALELTRQNLTYRFASSEPKAGGMDCSGTIYHLLQASGLSEAPRQSDEICLWVKEKSRLQLTPEAHSLDDAVFAQLRPGDLLFWTGTYASTERKLPVTHVMLFIGHRKSDGHPVIFGASDGRTYQGQSQCGVSIFDFELPKPGAKASFYGFGTVPGIVREEIKKAEPK